MSYILSATTIKSPTEMEVQDDIQTAQNRTLDGSINRDYFGSNKRTWFLRYRNAKKADYDTIRTIYETHLSSGSTVTWQITETNYTVAETNVQMDLRVRGFSVGGEDYISNFDLILTEA